MPYADPDKKKECDRRAEVNRKKKNGSRYRCWSLIFYPESAPAGWKQMLSELCLKVWVSPLHDKDVWTDKDELDNPAHKSGTFKKPHFHLVVQYDDKVDRVGFLSDFEFLNGSPFVERVYSLVSSVRYLTHEDDPAKARYSKEDVSCFGGAEVDLAFQLSSTQRRRMIYEMELYIREHGVIYYSDFSDWCAENNWDWYCLLVDNSTYVIEKYIKSCAYQLENSRRLAAYDRSIAAAQRMDELSRRNQEEAEGPA